MNNHKDFPDDYRFEFKTDDMKNEVDAHSPVLRDGCYVPTVKEVRETSIEHLQTVIIDWIWESPASLIPTNDQIEQVIEILQTRPDAVDCEKLLLECYTYINSAK